MASRRERLKQRELMKKLEDPQTQLIDNSYVEYVEAGKIGLTVVGIAFVLLVFILLIV